MKTEVKRKHTESAGIVLYNRNGEVLLVQQYGRSWSCPKGHLEYEEEILETALRELKEETGIPHQFIKIEKGMHSYTRDSRYGPPETKTIYLLPARLTQQMDNLALRSDEKAITDYKWVNHYDLYRLASRRWAPTAPRIDLCKEDAMAIIKTLGIMLEHTVPYPMHWAIKQFILK